MEILLPAPTECSVGFIVVKSIKTGSSLEIKMKTNQKLKSTVAVLTIGIAVLAKTPSYADTVYTGIGSVGNASTHGPLALADDGNFYGSTVSGGASGSGSVYRISPTGQYALLHSFTSLLGSFGSVTALGTGLFGTTEQGGSANQGTVFSVNTVNSNFTTLFEFKGTNGSYPLTAPVTQDGVKLFCTASMGGTYNKGALVCISNGVQIFATPFDGTNGYTPQTRLAIRTNDGMLYGTTHSGKTGYGNIFRANPTNGALVSLYNFTNGPDGSGPDGNLCPGPDGKLYGTTVGLNAYSAGTVFSFNPDTTNLTILHSFIEDASVNPQGVVFGPQGKLFGTTAYGGSNDQGVLYCLTTGGDLYKELYAFTGRSGMGQFFANSLTLAPDHSFYSTSVYLPTNTPYNFFNLSVPVRPDILTIFTTNQNVSVTFFSAPNQTYQLTGAFTNLPVFTNIGSSDTASGALTMISDSVPQPMQLYAVRDVNLSAGLQEMVNRTDNPPPRPSISGDWSGFPVMPIPPGCTNCPPNTNGINPSLSTR